VDGYGGVEVVGHDFRRTEYRGIHSLRFEDGDRQDLERQLAPDLSGIHPGHLERYFFAAKRVSGIVLDAACGCGYGSKIMHDSGSFVTGIDLEKEAIDYARLNYPGPEYILADVNKYSGEYDWVVSFETIEHLPEPEKALKLFRRCKRLIVSTPNQSHYPFDPAKFAGDRFPHVRHYTPAELDELLRSCGWKVLERHCQVGKKSNVTRGTEGMFIVYVCG
jgi:2-polyprenyl-3-methyl-5-hydroxy-6-metoxy-1,4-benzoquinol methylase